MRRADRRLIKRKDLRIINRIMIVFLLLIILLFALSLLHAKRVTAINQFMSYDDVYHNQIQDNRLEEAIILFEYEDELEKHIQRELMTFYNRQAEYERILHHKANLPAGVGIVEERRKRAIFQRDVILGTIQANKALNLELQEESAIREKLGSYVYVEL